MIKTAQAFLQVSPEDKGYTSAKIGLPTPFGLWNEIKARPISDLVLLNNKQPYKFPYKVCMKNHRVPKFWKKKWNLYKTLYDLNYYCRVGSKMKSLIIIFH